MKPAFTQHLPNLLTCMNLACGCAAVVYVFRGEIPVFSMLIACSLVFDFLDGFAARKLKAYSPMGKELDSLADMVTFGFVPGAIMHHLFLASVPAVLHTNETWVRMLSFLPFIITVFSALRLAKFNIDTRQTNSFIGLPTPACTIFVTGFALVLEYDRFDLTPTLLNTYIITGLSLILSYLLVAEIPLFALKFKNFNWSENKAQYTLILVSVVSILTLQFLAIPLIIVLYLILSLIYPSQPTTNISENN